MTLHKVNNDTIKDLVDSEGNESSIPEVKNVIILKEDMQYNSTNPKRIGKKPRKT
jgi:hypothetical protein